MNSDTTGHTARKLQARTPLTVAKGTSAVSQTVASTAPGPFNREPRRVTPPAAPSVPLTWQWLEHTRALHLHRQVEVGAVAQRDHLVGPAGHEPADPEGQLQGLAHAGLHLARGKLHAAGLDHEDLEDRAWPGPKPTGQDRPAAPGA